MHRALAVVAATMFFTSALPAQPPSSRNAGSIQVVCWDCFEAVPRWDAIPPSSFDVRLPLVAIPEDASGRQVLALAQQRASGASCGMSGMVHLYRWSTPDAAFLLVGGWRTRKTPDGFVAQLIDGDVLVFHGACNFVW